MKVLLAGAFGHLGQELLKKLVDAGHEVTAADIVTEDLYFEGFTPLAVDLTKEEEIQGICSGMDAVVSLVSLLKASPVSPYSIDYGANYSLLEEAKKAGVKHFTYVSIISPETGRDVPVVDAKFRFEEELKKSGLSYTVFRPTALFYDTAFMFKPNAAKGKVPLIKGFDNVRVNPIDARDLAEYMTAHLTDENVVLDIGGKKDYSLKELGELFFKAEEKNPKFRFVSVKIFDFVIKTTPVWNKCILMYNKWVMTHDRISRNTFGERSFEDYVEYIYENDILL